LFDKLHLNYNQQEAVGADDSGGVRETVVYFYMGIRFNDGSAGFD
jgi:hypothetical protein